ncbi:MAG: hypothetical protein ABI076_01395 [Acidobacteriaceae bacterium]
MILVLDQRLAIGRNPLVVILAAGFDLLAVVWIDERLPIQRWSAA